MQNQQINMDMQNMQSMNIINPMNQSNQLSNNFNQEISDAFFNFNAILLSNYNQFLNRDFYSSNTMPCLEILFKVPNYLKIISSEKSKRTIYELK